MDGSDPVTGNETNDAAPPRDLATYPPPSAAARHEVVRRGVAPPTAEGLAGAGPRLRRIFWIGAVVILVVAALVAIAAVIDGEFTDTDGQILATLGSLLLACATAISGLSLVEQRKLSALGWVAVASAAAGFTLLTASIWNDFENETLARWAGTAAVVLLGMLLATTSRLLLRATGLLVVYGCMLVALSLAVLLTVGALWSEDASDGAGKAIATFWILAVLGWLLVPVLQRFTAAGPRPTDVRVLATLGDVELLASRSPLEGVAVEPPASGERLVLRRRA